MSKDKYKIKDFIQWLKKEKGAVIYGYNETLELVFEWLNQED